MKDDSCCSGLVSNRTRRLLVGAHEGPIRAAAVLPTATSPSREATTIPCASWSLNRPRQLHVLTEHTQPIVACAVSPDNRTGSQHRHGLLLCEWNIKEGKLIRKFEIPASLAVAYLPDGKSVLIGTADNSAMVFDLDKQQRSLALPGHKGKVMRFASRATANAGLPQETISLSVPGNLRQAGC